MKVRTKIEVTAIYSKEETAEVKELINHMSNARFKHVISSLATETEQGNYRYAKQFDHFSLDMLKKACQTTKLQKNGYTVFLKKKASDFVQK